MFRVLLRSLLIVATCGVIHDRINADSSMVANDWFDINGSRSSGDHTLFFYDDPELGYIVYWTGNGWSTATDYGGGYGYHYQQLGPGNSSSYLYMSEDGNLMHIVDSAGGGVAIWQTHTGGNWGAYLRLQNDENLVVRSSSDAPLWSLF